MTVCVNTVSHIVHLHMQCCIDLKENVLRIGTTGKHALFLTEKDLQEKMEMEKQQAVRECFSFVKLFVNPFSIYCYHIICLYL